MKTNFEDSPLGYTANFANNEISYIEDGTFDHVTSITYQYFHYNRLTEIPRGADFYDGTSSKLIFYYNRITRIKSGTFKNYRSTYSM